MSSRTRLLVFLVSTPLVVLVAVGGSWSAPVRGASAPSYPPLRVFQDVIQSILGAYVEDVDVDRSWTARCAAWPTGSTRPARSCSPTKSRRSTAKAPLPAGDVGLVVTRQFYLRVVGVRDGSPAARAGLQSGDFIRVIDDKPTRDMSALTGTRLLRGAPGPRSR